MRRPVKNLESQDDNSCGEVPHSFREGVRCETISPGPSAHNPAIGSYGSTIDNLLCDWHTGSASLDSQRHRGVDTRGVAA